MVKEKRNNRTLLLVDDDKNVLKSLVRVLSPDGYEIHTFDRSIDALSMMQSVPVGVIIADHCMPYMEGAEFLRRAEGCQPGCVMLVLSGYYDSHSVNKVVNHCNAWRYIPKPWVDEELRTIVSAAFDRFNGQ